MAELCLIVGPPRIIRVALQDPCSHLPIPGPNNGYAISCIRNWSIEPIVVEGEVSEFKSDTGLLLYRDKQDDQPLGYTISFEVGVRTFQLESLLTGDDTIDDSGGDTIGLIKLASSQGCITPAQDPRFIVETFHNLPKCSTQANTLRAVFPMAQFKVTEIDREGTIAIYRYTAETGTMNTIALGDGPYDDFPTDVVTEIASRPADELTRGIEFYENITVSGNCGYIAVP